MSRGGARIEWNNLPGLLAAERLPGEVRERFNRLDIFDAKTVEEFLGAPIKAIEHRIERRAHRQDGGDTQSDLLTLVMRFATVCVMAERERAAEEQRLKERAEQNNG